MVVGVSKPGNNVIEANVSGVQGVGVNSPVINFSSKEKSNRFFLIKIEYAVITNELVLVETTKNAWKGMARN